jgi:hypothetical protein
MSETKGVLNEEQIYNCDTDLETEYNQLKCNENNYYSANCNKFQLKKELVERECLKEEEVNEEDPFLYPNLNDTNFNIKIAEKKEFNDNKYDGTIHANVKEHSDILAKAEFELSPHQAFVKNFLSFQTPYNSLLLYHGLGSGKTCSAIGVCEEMRDYLKQMGISKRIIIVASENVQDNFKLQLFDERKLKLVDGLWTIRGCVGNKLLKEINPMSMKGMSKDKVASQIKALINTTYLFLGYGQFANYIIKTIKYDEDVSLDEYLEETKKKGPTKIETVTNLDKKMIQRLKAEFNNRMIVIDEVHNIRKEDDNKNKKVAINLEILVKAAENMRFLFLSATPMYNNYTEIIWLLNIMNTNDRRGRISVSDVFDKEGNFKPGGEDLLIRKATGYISFVRGENPYTFPYRVYPVNFAEENTFITNEEGEPLYHSYPNYQMNGIEIKQEEDSKNLIQYLKYNTNSIYLNTIGNCNLCGVCQACVYKYIIYNLKNKTFNITTKTGQIRQMPKFEDMESFGYTLLQTPLESLIISYPIRELKGALDKISNGSEREAKASADPEAEAEIYIDPHDLTGKKGLERMMTCIDSKSPPEKGSFEYKRSTLDTYDRIFSKELIGNYSSKIKSILDKIVSPETGEMSEGIILIYSQYIDGGLIPVALALEEMGFTRYGKGAKNLFKTNPTEPLMLPMSNNTKKVPARYSMITGDIRISPDNDFEIKGLTGEDNKDGYKVKVVLISKAGSEGIDLKFIRQVHILEPWYNMNLLEQVIGRAVRNFSHKDLPFEKRNVQIFMYGTLLDDNTEETADLYVYRIAGVKAIQIGKISRLLKQTAVDCIINHDQQNFSQKIMLENIEGTITQELSTGKTITDFKIGDAPFSPACDYLSTCTFDCIPDKKIADADLNEDTYNENYIIVNSDKILQRIRMIMKEGFFYKKDVLINAIKTPKEYPLVQIYAALTQLIEDSSEIIEDKYGRPGRLINIGDYYLFQPSELTYKNASIYDRSVPIDVKHSTINFGVEKQVKGKKNKGLVIEEEKEEVIISPDRFIEGKRVFDELKANFELANKFTIRKIETDLETGKQRIVPNKVERGDDNWYKHSGIVIAKLKDEGIPLSDLFSFVVYHAIELLLFEEKVELLNYIYSLESIEQNSVEDLVKQYFSKNSIHITETDPMGNKRIIGVGFVLFKLNKMRIMILNKDKIWVEGEPEDERKVKESEEGVIYFKVLNKSLYNNIVGFIGYEKNNKYMVFKTKNLNSKRDTGARCDEAGKTKTMALLNEILGVEKYTNETTKKVIDANKNVISEAISQDELCVTQEFYLRYYNKSNKNLVKWFLTPEMAIYYELYKIVLK